MKLKQRTSLAVLLATLPFFSLADVWDELKSIPATQYDVGKIYIGVFALEINKILKGENIEETKYKVRKISSIDKNELGLTFSLEARGKYINPNDCSGFASLFQQNMMKKGIVDDVWSSLNSDLKNKLKQSFVVEVKLINKDNDAIMITCRS
ncbi:hypothetical protein [Vibrio harveyi]|uniref:hypothetical protein n=1 Tax=Vibrio harveyi TaxID=669 RepID=UPI0023806BC7|nr:hypothetical protein [Vibrio harveyi]